MNMKNPQNATQNEALECIDGANGDVIAANLEENIDQIEKVQPKPRVRYERDFYSRDLMIHMAKYNPRIRKGVLFLESIEDENPDKNILELRKYNSLYLAATKKLCKLIFEDLTALWVDLSAENPEKADFVDFRKDRKISPLVAKELDRLRLKSLKKRKAEMPVGFSKKTLSKETWNRLKQIENPKRKKEFESELDDLWWHLSEGNIDKHEARVRARSLYKHYLSKARECKLQGNYKAGYDSIYNSFLNRAGLVKVEGVLK
jgi:hypothetical protein